MKEFTRKYWGPLAAFLATLVILFRTAFRTIAGGDSGEVITTALLRGLAHPPGYPTFTFLSWLVGLLPIPGWSAAFKVNVFSILCSALGSFFLALITPGVCGVAISLLFAFSPIPWLYSTHGEVFAMNNMFAALLLVLFARYFQKPSIGRILTGAFFFGLAMTNQHTISFLILPAIIYLLLHSLRKDAIVTFKQLIAPKVLVSIIGLGVLGLLPYLYLPWAYHNHAYGSWGNPSTIDGFLTHFLRKEYGTWRLAKQVETYDETFHRIFMYLVHVWQTYPIPTVILGVSILVVSPFSDPFSLLCIACWVFYVAVFNILANLDLEDPLTYGVSIRFWMQPDITFLAFVARQMGRVRAWAAEERAKEDSKPDAAKVGVLVKVKKILYRSRNVLMGIFYAALVVSLAVFLTKWDLNDFSKVDVTYDFGECIIRALPPDALLLTDGDMYINAIRYVQQIDNVRRDVYVIDQELMSLPWFIESQKMHYPNMSFPKPRYHPYLPDGFDLQELLKHNKHREDVFGKEIKAVFTAKGVKHKDNSLDAWSDIPWGMAELRVANRRKKGGGVASVWDRVDFHKWLKFGYEALDCAPPMKIDREQVTAVDLPNILISPERLYPNDSWENQSFLQFCYAASQYGFHALEYAMQLNATDEKIQILDDAVIYLKNALRCPHQPHDIKNFGVVYLQASQPVMAGPVFKHWLEMAETHPDIYKDADYVTLKEWVENMPEHMRSW